MKKTFILGLLAAMPVLAQQEAPTTKDLPVPPQGATQAPHWGARGEMPQPNARKDFHKKMLEEFDTDKDGQLNDAEKDAMKAEMQKRRTEGNNRPGVRGDRRPQGPQGDKKGHPGREDMHKKMLEKFDTDKDGQLSDAEKEAIKAQMPKRPEGKRGARHNNGANRPATLEL